MQKWLTIAVIWLAAVIRINQYYKTRPEYETGQTVALTMRLSQWPQPDWEGEKISMKNWVIRLPVGTEAEYGQKVRIVGKISKKVIRGRDTQYLLEASDSQILQEKGWREKAITSLKSWLPGDEGALAAGILLGGSEGLSSEGRQAFRNTGLAHVVAASGYNVGVVAGWTLMVGSKLWGRRKAIPFVIFSIVLYMVMAGGSAAVVRAGVLAIITLLALSLGRPIDAGLGLAAAAGAALIYKPEWLEDVGWQLSVAAMAGLIWVEPKLVGKWQDLRTTLAAQVTTMPLILHYFGNLSTAAPLVNGLLLWTVPLIMQISALAVGAGLIWEPVGQWVAWTAWPLLKLLAESAKWVGAQTWAGMMVEKMSLLWVMVYYLTLVMLIKFPIRLKK